MLLLTQCIVASGVPVYLYEFQDAPSVIKKNKPSFVGVDHADELFFIQGCCFTKAHITITGKTNVSETSTYKNTIFTASKNTDFSWKVYKKQKMVCHASCFNPLRYVHKGRWWTLQNSDGLLGELCSHWVKYPDFFTWIYMRT